MHPSDDYLVKHLREANEEILVLRHDLHLARRAHDLLKELFELAQADLQHTWEKK